MRYEPIAQARAEASREDCEQQVALEQREVVADADPRAGCEGMVGVPVTGGLGIPCPPIGVEAVGIGPEVGMPVCVERREHDCGPGRHVEATDLVVLDGIPRVERRRWVQPKDLFHDLKRVREVMQFLEGWCMVSEDGVEARRAAAQRLRGASRVRTRPPPWFARSSHGRRKTW